MALGNLITAPLMDSTRLRSPEQRFTAMANVYVVSFSKLLVDAQIRVRRVLESVLKVLSQGSHPHVHVTRKPTIFTSSPYRSNHK